MIFFVQMGGFLFDWVGPYAPFVFAGIGNLLIMLYAVWLLRTADKPQLQEVDGLVEMTGSRVT